MTLIEFINYNAIIDSPMGDLAIDILNDKSFPFGKSDKLIFRYLDLKTSQGGSSEFFIDFINQYKEQLVKIGK